MAYNRTRSIGRSVDSIEELEFVPLDSASGNMVHNIDDHMSHSLSDDVITSDLNRRSPGTNKSGLSGKTISPKAGGVAVAKVEGRRSPRSPRTGGPGDNKSPRTGVAKKAAGQKVSSSTPTRITPRPPLKKKLLKQTKQTSSFVSNLMKNSNRNMMQSLSSTKSSLLRDSSPLKPQLPHLPSIVVPKIDVPLLRTPFVLEGKNSVNSMSSINSQSTGGGNSIVGGLTNLIEGPSKENKIDASTLLEMTPESFISGSEKFTPELYDIYSVGSSPKGQGKSGNTNVNGSPHVVRSTSVGHPFAPGSPTNAKNPSGNPSVVRSASANSRKSPRSSKSESQRSLSPLGGNTTPSRNKGAVNRLSPDTAIPHPISSVRPVLTSVSKAPLLKLPGSTKKTLFNWSPAVSMNSSMGQANCRSQVNSMNRNPSVNTTPSMTGTSSIPTDAINTAGGTPINTGIRGMPPSNLVNPIPQMNGMPIMNPTHSMPPVHQVIRTTPTTGMNQSFTVPLRKYSNPLLTPNFGLVGGADGVKVSNPNLDGNKNGTNGTNGTSNGGVNKESPTTGVTKTLDGVQDTQNEIKEMQCQILRTLEQTEGAEKQAEMLREISHTKQLHVDILATMQRLLSEVEKMNVQKKTMTGMNTASIGMNHTGVNTTEMTNMDANSLNRPILSTTSLDMKSAVSSDNQSDDDNVETSKAWSAGRKSRLSIDADGIAVQKRVSITSEENENCVATPEDGTTNTAAGDAITGKAISQLSLLSASQGSNAQGGCDAQAPQGQKKNAKAFGKGKKDHHQMKDLQLAKKTTGSQSDGRGSDRDVPVSPAGVKKTPSGTFKVENIKTRNVKMIAQSATAIDGFHTATWSSMRTPTSEIASPMLTNGMSMPQGRLQNGTNPLAMLTITPTGDEPKGPDYTPEQQNSGKRTSDLNDDSFHANEPVSSLLGKIWGNNNDTNQNMSNGKNEGKKHGISMTDQQDNQFQQQQPSMHTNDSGPQFFNIASTGSENSTRGFFNQGSLNSCIVRNASMNGGMGGGFLNLNLGKPPQASSIGLLHQRSKKFGPSSRNASPAPVASQTSLQHISRSASAASRSVGQSSAPPQRQRSAGATSQGHNGQQERAGSAAAARPGSPAPSTMTHPLTGEMPLRSFAMGSMTSTVFQINTDRLVEAGKAGLLAFQAATHRPAATYKPPPMMKNTGMGPAGFSGLHAKSTSILPNNYSVFRSQSVLHQRSPIMQNKIQRDVSVPATKFVQKRVSISDE